MDFSTKHRLGALAIGIVSGVVVGSLTAFYFYRYPADTPSKTGPAFGIDDRDLLLYLEAMTQIKRRAYALGPEVTRGKIVEQSIKAYLARDEICCDYLTREEYRKFKESLDESYVGIGLEITRDRDGRIICAPIPGGPAARAGIGAGAVLKEIDGVPVEGKSIFAIGAIARGRPGTDVSLAVMVKNGPEKRIRVTRSNLALQSVLRRSVGGRPIIDISFFTRETSFKLREVLESWERDRPIIIDLRGNGGGDLHAAIDSVTLFLKEGRRIVSVESRNGTNVFESKKTAVNVTTPIYLWQDETTASSAEVFIAALTENNRAVSIGKKTFGKGSVEEIIELSDGSALILTTGTLRTPRGTRYQGRGLEPTHELKGARVDTNAYLARVKGLTG